MNVIAVDDEPISLECLQVVLSSIEQIDSVNIFPSSIKTLEYVKKNNIDVAFLDIEMDEMNGLDLAANIKKICPHCKIIFVTSTPKYAFNAIQLHANGYLVKPVTKEAICRELDFIKTENLQTSAPPVQQTSSPSKLSIKTFGNFEVFYNGEPVKFLRSKSKELLAYLIDRKGANCSVGELCAVLWEDKDDDEALQAQLRKVISDLKKTLASIGFEDILIKSRGYLAIVPERLNCDYYDFLNKDITAINSFAGEYMLQYSWSEFTVGYLESQCK